MSVALIIAFMLVLAFCWRRIVPGTIERSLAARPAPRFARRRDKVGEASMDSFPCSDPPAWTLGVEALPFAPAHQDARKGS